MLQHRSSTEAAALLRVVARGDIMLLVERSLNRESVRRVRSALWPLRVAARALETMSVLEFMDKLDARAAR